MNIALVGNPNCGKTTLYNILTGTYNKTGNWSGVTVDSKKAKLKGEKDAYIIDLPGIYSLEESSLDQKKAIDYIKTNKVDKIINIVDGTNLERGLYLTNELSKLNIPIIIAINMFDQLEKEGITIDKERLSSLFNCPVIFISAKKNKNIKELITKTKGNNLIPLSKLNNKDSVFIELEGVVKKLYSKKPTKYIELTNKIDSIVLNKILSFPILFVILFLVYFTSIKIGGSVGNILSDFIVDKSYTIKNEFIYNGVPKILSSLCCDGIIKGVGSVISFLPQVIILFFLMSILEESGYATRIVYILDSLFKRVGLSGRVVLPLILSCGCTTSGILATKSIENERERKTILFLLPFMPCSAKVAVFAYLSSVLFNGNALVATSMYFLGVFVVAVFSYIFFKRNKYKGQDFFALEMPLYRFPTMRNTLKLLCEKTKDFILKAGSVIFLVSLLIWSLRSFGMQGYTENIENSFLYSIGNVIKYVFIPLGFCNAEVSISLITGIFAKEAVAESLQILAVNIGSVFNNPFSALSFMSFILLSPPCISALSVARKQLTNKDFVKMIVFEVFVAYIVALLINAIGNIFYILNGLILSIIIGIILLIGIIISIKNVFSCGNCKNCKKSIVCKKNQKHNMTL